MREMDGASARYDAIAEWYAERSRDWNPEPDSLLPDDLRGQRVLDMACGDGRTTRYLAVRGARATGVDLSEALLTRARRTERRTPLGITYLHGDAASTRWWDGAPYDGVLCHMALMDIDDLDGAFSTVAATLKPGGWFCFSLFHPCCPGGPEGSWSGPSSWPPDGGYAREGWWNTGFEGIRGRVGGNHRMLSTYLNAAVRAGLTPEQFRERGVSVPFILAARYRRQV